MLGLILIPLYALADRFAGGGWPWLDDRLPGRGAFWAALALAGVGWLTLGLLGPLAALAWFIWRTPAWGLFKGSMAPRGLVEFAGTVLRHLIAVPLLMLAAYWGGHSWALAAGCAFGFVTVATALAEWLGYRVDVARDEHRPLGQENTYLELARGAAFGVAVCCVAYL